MAGQFPPGRRKQIFVTDWSDSQYSIFLSHSLIPLHNRPASFKMATRDNKQIYRGVSEKKKFSENTDIDGTLLRFPSLFPFPNPEVVIK